MNIVDNLQKIKYELPQNVSLVAVSKTKPNEDIILAYNTGQLDFGENKIQELILKHDALPKDIKWHMIGHLQTNKVKYIAPFIHLIHSVDSIKLIKEINKQAINNTKIINILIQIDITNDKTKFGFSINDFDMIMKDELLSTFNNLKVVGLMGMASFTNNQDIIKSQFNSLKDLFNKHKKKLSLDNSNLKL